MEKSFMIMNIMFISFLSIIMLIINLIPSNNKNIHPIMMSLILLILSMIMSMNISIYMNSHWFSFIMFLILIGGMMILFLYFTSFINNMKMSMKWIYIYNIPFKITLLIMLLMLMLTKLNYNLNWYNSFNEILSMINLIKFNNLNNLNMYLWMYLYNKNFPTLISMLYLLLVLTLIVKICINKKFSIRKMI